MKWFLIVAGFLFISLVIAGLARRFSSDTTPAMKVHDVVLDNMPDLDNRFEAHVFKHV